MKEELKLILEGGETHSIEFKEGLEGVDKEMVAFANSSGGRVLLGVRDDGTVKGIKITNKLKSQVQDIANNCEPRIHITLDEIDDILLIKVPEGTNKPHMCKRGFFIRIGPNSQKLSRDEILKFAVNEGKVVYDEEINPAFDFKMDFDEKSFSEFLKASEITVNLPFENILFNMNLARKMENEHHFKNVVSLFFSKNIRKFNSSAYTTCILFKGNTRANIIDRKDFDGNLIEQVEDAIRFVEKNIMLTYQIKGLVRKEIPQYPPGAIREGIVNAIMHRDYLEKGSNVFVYIHDDFIEITNPGGLFGITRDQLGKICARRNERVADLFKMVGLVEKAGTGIQRMNDTMRKSGLKEPNIEASENFFMITFRGHKKGELSKISEGREVIALNERQKRALELIKKNERVTIAELIREYPDVNRKTLTRDMDALIRTGLVKRMGRGRRDLHYVIA
ncbi:MAG: putative DNA binding domain-containing protein [Candidatus Altiarchaeales archaeon]|nr:putative DNA binding domain-containing protein [Candidatus Altiarchaeota archaeon]MCG2783192.1 putative DNA binding domain-containing protein [Candidatus Altiarchaeales archaeon]